MRYYRVRDEAGEIHQTVEVDGGRLASLTSGNGEVRDFRDLLRASDISGRSVDEITRHLLARGSLRQFGLDEVVASSKTGHGCRLLRPADPDEMWAGGIGNYPMPAEAVQKMPEGTRVAYESDRPSFAYKGTASRLAGPFDPIGARSDVDRTIAEGELVLIVYKGRLVGYSTGIEAAGALVGKSMWWMVPSKVFKGCASLGPCIVTPESLPNPVHLQIELTVTRKGQEVAKVKSVTTLRRSPEDQVRWAVEHDSPPDLAAIWSGGCVAAIQSPLQAGDRVRVSTEGIGFVDNPVEQV